MNFKDFLNEKVKYMNLNQLKKQLKKDYGSKASSLKIVKIKGGVSIQTPSGQELERYNNVPKLGYTVVEKNESLEESRGDLMKSAEYLKLINQAMSAMPGSPKQKGIIKKINAIRVKAGFKPLDEADGCWDGFKKVGMKKKGDKVVPNCVPEEIEEEMKCPPATQDLAINTKNRDATIKKYNYGPLNVDEPGNYWEKIAKYWKTTTAAAK